jgi:type I restriction enzyme S subunit
MGVNIFFLALNVLPKEQKRIAEIVDATNARIAILKTKQTHYQTLKRGLMQKLLTGEWRVKLDATTGEQP